MKEKFIFNFSTKLTKIHTLNFISQILNQILLVLFYIYSDRLSATQCLEHDWFSQAASPVSSSPLFSTHPVEQSTAPSLSSIQTDEQSSDESTVSSTLSVESTQSIVSSTLSVESTQDVMETDSDKCSTVENDDKCSTVENDVSEAGESPVVAVEDISPIKKTEDSTHKGMNGERRRSFMKNMEDLVKKLELDYETQEKKKDEKEESNLRRATSMQTMPVPNLVRYKLDSKFSKNVVIDDDPLFKYKRLFIFDDLSDTSSPPSSNYGSMSSDNSSMSDSASEMSLDSSSDRSSIISLDDTLDVMYSKNHRHYSSCYNVWEAVRNKNNTRVWPRECDGSFARALSRFTTSPGDVGREGYHPLRNKNSLTIFKPTTYGRKCIGLELMKERNGNIVVIREIKAINGSKYPRCSEVKCESLQSRIRRLQVQNGLRTELDKSSSSCSSNDIF